MAFQSLSSLRFSSALHAGLLGAVSLLAVDTALGQEASTDGVLLESVTVEGTQERGDGPVQGYVARQSQAGTKTDTPIAETPQSISVVPRQQMEDQQVESVAEALRYTPGVFSEYRGASNVRDEVFVRGFSYIPRYLDGMLVGATPTIPRSTPISWNGWSCSPDPLPCFTARSTRAASSTW